jgi:hypothetical protein
MSVCACHGASPTGRLSTVAKHDTSNRPLP